MDTITYTPAGSALAVTMAFQVVPPTSAGGVWTAKLVLVNGSNKTSLAVSGTGADRRRACLNAADVAAAAGVLDS